MSAAREWAPTAKTSVLSLTDARPPWSERRRPSGRRPTPQARSMGATDADCRGSGLPHDPMQVPRRKSTARPARSARLADPLRRRQRPASH